jgi:translation initiation factor 1
VKRTRRSPRLEAGAGWTLTRDDAAGDPGATGPEGAGHPLARWRLERRRGKAVTVAALEGLSEAEQRDLGRELKARCGSGGTVRGGAVELQGDHRDALRAFLPQRGLQVKG